MARLAAPIALVAAALALLPAPAAAKPAAPCGHAGYSYAGLGGLTAVGGVAATIRLNNAPQVAAGHVAAWVGLGGYGAGPQGSNAWVQAGIITKAGFPPLLYYEVTRPGAEPELVVLGTAEIGRDYRIAVREGQRDNYWRVDLDGRNVSPGLFLPGSHNAWEGTATTESWNDNAPVCNRFDVGFRTVEVRGDSGLWRPFGRAVALEAPGYAIASRTASSFRALG
jgi:hypothetical protein